MTPTFETGFLSEECTSKTHLRIVFPGNPEETRNIKLPQTLQKLDSILCPLAISLCILNFVILSFPLTYLRVSSLMMKLVANMDEVILRSSVQWQMNLMDEKFFSQKKRETIKGK